MSRVRTTQGRGENRHISMKLDYRNEYLRKQVENNTQLLLLYIVMVLGSAILIFLSFFNTYREMKSYPIIDFHSIEEYADTMCKVEINEVPVELQSGYYMAKAGNNAIVMKKTDKWTGRLRRAQNSIWRIMDITIRKRGNG